MANMIILITDDGEKPIWIWPDNPEDEVSLSVMIGTGPIYNLTGREFLDRLNTADGPSSFGGPSEW